MNENYLKHVSLLKMQDNFDEVIKEVDTLKDNPNNYLALATKASLVACLATHENKKSSYDEAIELIDKAIKIIDGDVNNLSVLITYETEIRIHFYFMNASENERNLLELLSLARQENNEKDILEYSDKLLEINPKNAIAYLMKASSETYSATKSNAFVVRKRVMSYLDKAIKSEKSWTRIVENNREWFIKNFISLDSKEGVELKVETKIMNKRQAELEQKWATYDEQKKKLQEMESEKIAQAEEKSNNRKIISLLILLSVAVIVLLAHSSLGFVATLIIEFIVLVIFGAIFLPTQKPNEYMICPHCNTKGQVFTQSVRVKKGIDGGKATAAVLTGGLSTVVTGLSQIEDKTRARCEKCKMTWEI